MSAVTSSDDRAPTPVQGASTRYQVLAPIASGGMASVHLGRHVERDGSTRTVAIKVMHPYLAGDPEMVAMFLDEARVSTKIRHPHVVSVTDVDMVGDDLTIVMEYVPGVSLLSLQRAVQKRDKRLPIGVTLRIMLDALAGLHAAHELADEAGQPLKIVHRDVSPHNVLVGSDGYAKVMDFGVATAAGRLAQTQADGTVKGKLRYLSPEQLHRKPLDRRVDVFAAGIVLWESLTGESLFGTGTEAETLGRVLRHPIAPPSNSAPGIPLALDEVCLKALERDRDRRYGSAKELAEAIEAAAGSLLASREQVAELVRELAGEELARHKQALDETRSPSTRVPALARTDTGWGVSADPPPSKRGSSRTFLVALLSLAVGGVLAWGALRATEAPKSTASTEPTAPSASSAPVAIEIFEPAASAASTTRPAAKSTDAGARPNATSISPSKKGPQPSPSKGSGQFMPSEL